MFLNNLNAPSSEVQLAKRLRRLPKEQRKIILQLVNKCEYTHSHDLLSRHVKNAGIILSQNKVDANVRLPAVKRGYIFVDKVTGARLSLRQVANNLQKTRMSIYRYINKRNATLFGKYDVVREENEIEKA